MATKMLRDTDDALMVKKAGSQTKLKKTIDLPPTALLMALVV